MAALCNFLSHLSTGSDNVVTRNIAVDRLIALRSGKMRGRGDNFVKSGFGGKPRSDRAKAPCQVETLINAHCSDSFMFSRLSAIDVAFR